MVKIWPLIPPTTLILFSVEELTGTEGLISVRSRSGFSRPFTLVDEIEREAERRYRAKERELERRLKETEQKIARMQVERTGSGEVILTAEQQKEINEARLLADRTELELREVKGNLRRDIDALETTVKFDRFSTNTGGDSGGDNRLVKGSQAQ